MLIYAFRQKARPSSSPFSWHLGKCKLQKEWKAQMGLTRTLQDGYQRALQFRALAPPAQHLKREEELITMLVIATKIPQTRLRQGVLCQQTCPTSKVLAAAIAGLSAILQRECGIMCMDLWSNIWDNHLLLICTGLQQFSWTCMLAENTLVWILYSFTLLARFCCFNCGTCFDWRARNGCPNLMVHKFILLGPVFA